MRLPADSNETPDSSSASSVPLSNTPQTSPLRFTLPQLCLFLSMLFYTLIVNERRLKFILFQTHRAIVDNDLLRLLSHQIE